MTPENRERIRTLNDQFRTTFEGGTVVMTVGVRARSAAFLRSAVSAVQTFTAFTEANDPHGEHDFGLVEVDQQPVFWKIDYYDEGLSAAAEDPADPDTCHRVLTIMLADEY